MKSGFHNNNHLNLHMNSNYMAVIEQKTNSSQSASDCRTPIAWHNRTVNLTKPLTLAQSPQNGTNFTAKYRRTSGQRLSQRASSPSATTTSSDDREEVPMVRHHIRRPQSRVNTSNALTVDRRQPQYMTNNKFGNHFIISGDYSLHPMHPLRSGTLRSTKSVPALALSQQHDSCPVHGSNGHSHGLMMSNCQPHPHSHPHHYFPSIPNQTLNFRRFGSFADIRDTRIPINSNGLPFLTPIPEHKQSCALMPVYYTQPQTLPSLPALPAPNNIQHMHLVPSKGSTRSMVFPAYAEPLPFRNHFKMSSPVSPVPSHRTVKMANNYGNSDICCRGHLIVLWVILGVVTVGVISGIILAVTIN